MSNEIATRESAPGLTERISKAVIDGDLSLLNTDEKLQFYVLRCRQAGLPETCRPFAFIKDKKGKLILYALKECGELLNAQYGISHSMSGVITDEKGGIVEVMVQATRRDGRSTVDIGAVSIQGLKGEDLANARMKAITKAKRRATLSLCGLGDMPDETELETMGQLTACNDKGTPIPIDNSTGHGSGKYCSDADAKACIEAEDRYRIKRNEMWLDRWSDKATGEIPDGVSELCPRIYQADNHCAKWAIKAGLLRPESMDESGLKPAQLGKLTGIIYKDTPNKLKNELKRYFDELERVAMQALQLKHPELFDAVDPADGPGDGEVMDEIADAEWEDGRE